MHECLLTSVQKFLQYQPQFWKSVFQTADSCENSKSHFLPLDSQVSASALSVGVVAAASNKDKSNNITSNEYSPFLLLNLDELYSDTNMTLRGIDLQPDVGK
jgi:hypothetical protein